MDFREAVFKILGLSSGKVRDKNIPQLEAEVCCYFLIIIIYFLSIIK